MRAIGARALERPRRKRGPGRGAGVGVRVRRRGQSPITNHQSRAMLSQLLGPVNTNGPSD
ncbi:hypothetical protein DYQ48_09925 [Xanthomonas hortorum]|nr:hypothetical protein DYQ48_09925 [Xanthomonas hortorum]